MELRSLKQKNELNDLRNTLSGLGLYEDGMEVEEMRQMLVALQESVDESHCSNGENVDYSLERALRESELDFMPPLSANNGDVLSSTLIGVYQQNVRPHRYVNYRRNLSPFSSPEPDEQARILTVQADVHHPLDWSPPASEEQQRLQRKRSAESETDTQTPSALPMHNFGPSEAKRPLLYDSGNGRTDSSCSTGGHSDSEISISIHSSLMSSSDNTCHSNQSNNSEQINPAYSGLSFAYSNNGHTGIDYIVNRENYECSKIPSSSGDIDYDCDHQSEFSN